MVPEPSVAVERSLGVITVQGSYRTCREVAPRPTRNGRQTFNVCNCLLVKDSLHAWLTTLRPDGSPHTTPVWFILQEDAFWFASAMTNVKVNNVRWDPRVSVALDGSGLSPWVAEGQATLHQVNQRQNVTHEFETKYGWDLTDETYDGPRLLIEVKVQRWLLRPGGQ